MRSIVQWEIEVVQLLLSHNANVNGRNGSGWTPLHSASANGHTKVAQLLLEYGADVDARNEIDDTPWKVRARSSTTPWAWGGRTRKGK
ncbi:ankyrin repeat-containing domain protein [Lactifluus subvellereus]|nr:ankyrin repeat-containing domain protein [Lactifluus subvellereus]